MNAIVDSYVDHIRERFGIGQRELMTARNFPLRHAASQRATSPGFAGGGNRPRRLASLSRCATGGGGMRVLHAHAGGGLAFARGPPLRSSLQKTQPNPPQRSRV